MLRASANSALASELDPLTLTSLFTRLATKRVHCSTAFARKRDRGADTSRS